MRFTKDEIDVIKTALDGYTEFLKDIGNPNSPGGPSNMKTVARNIKFSEHDLGVCESIINKLGGEKKQ